MILKTGHYPKQWNKSYLILLHKSGDKLDPSNYRGISLINCIAKIFSGILNNRLKEVMKDKYSNSQFGFRENHRTSDSLFILKAMINKYLHKNKRKLYFCFVDFKKAFDSVWRDGLLYKLAEIGIGKFLYHTIKNMLDKTQIAIKVGNKHSEFFEIQRGVKQGDSISPTLFNIFINDLSSNFNLMGCNPPKLLNSSIGSLSFADDLLIISESKEGLQNSVDKLNTFCENWQLTLNVKKTKTMVVQPHNNLSLDSFIDFNGNKIQNVNEYKFLGSILKCNGDLKHSLEELSTKARKV